MRQPASRDHSPRGDGAGVRARLAAHGPWILALAAAAAVVWEIDILRSGEVLVALMNHDLFQEFFPRHHYQGSVLAAGRIPLWDPHQIAGLPFLATLQAGVLYPPNLLYTALPTGTAMGILGLLHVALSGIFTYALARALGRGPGAATLAGLAFMLGGSTLFLVYHTNAINSAPWLPAVLWCATRLQATAQLRWSLWLALALALQFLAGRDYTFVMTAHLLGLLVLFQLLWMWRDGAGARRLWLHAGQVALAGGLAGGLAAAQILPTLDLAAHSGRPLFGLEPHLLETFGPMPPSLYLANLVHPLRGALRREYIGWIPLLLFLVSFRLWGRDRLAIFASATALLSLGLVFGSATPLFDAYRVLPLAATFRMPDRFLYTLSLAIALGAACGFDRLLGRNAAQPLSIRDLLAPALFAALLAALLASGNLGPTPAESAKPWGWFWYYGVSAQHYAGIGAALLWMALGAATLGAARAGVLRGRAGVAGVAVLAIAAADLGHAQRSPLLHPARNAANVHAGAACMKTARGLMGDYGRHLSFRLPDTHALKDKDGELYGSYSATHYDPLVTKRHAAYFAALQSGAPRLGPGPVDDVFMGFLRKAPAAERKVLLDLLGVEAVLVDARPRQRPHGLQPLLERLDRVARCRVATSSGAAPVDVYRNPDALPRTFVVSGTLAAGSPRDALERVVTAGFDPRREVVLEGADVDLEATGPRDTNARAEITAYDDTRVAIRVHTEQPGVLVLTDTYTRDWIAERNGETVAVYPADGLFRGVVVPAGESEIVFEYRPRAFRAGLGISAVACIAWLLLWFWSRGQRAPLL